jgi:hypothetical protein
MVLIAIMAGVISAGFTWFGWELFQNVFAIRRRAKAARAAEQAPQPDAEEKATEKPAAPEVKQKRA